MYVCISMIKYIYVVCVTQVFTSWLGACRERARLTKGISEVSLVMFFKTPTVDTVT